MYVLSSQNRKRPLPHDLPMRNILPLYFKEYNSETYFILFNIADAPKLFAKIQRTPGPADPLNLYCAPFDVFSIFFGNLTNVFPKFPPNLGKAFVPYFS